MIDQEPIEPDEQTMVIRRPGPPTKLPSSSSRRSTAAASVPPRCSSRSPSATARSSRRSRSPTAPSSVTRSATPSKPLPSSAGGPNSSPAAPRGASAPAGARAPLGPAGGDSGQRARSRPDRSLDRPGCAQAGTPGRNLGRNGNGERHEHRERRVVEVHRAAPLHRRGRKRWRVRGTGSFASHMTVSGSMSSEVASTAAVVFRGRPPTSPTRARPRREPDLPRSSAR